MTLSKTDHQLLKQILGLGSDIETRWTLMTTAEREQNFGRFRSLVSGCASAEAPELKRLASMERHLEDMQAMDLRHFTVVLVPFERLAGRVLRDDDFLVVEGDSSERGSATALAKVPLVAILDNMRSAFNVGSIFRTAECLGLERVILSGYSPRPDESKTAKTAMGTEERVTWTTVRRPEDCAIELKREGYRIIALETVASAPSLFDFSFPEKCALLVGNERFGLDPSALKLADGICRIPVFGVKNSLNVGIAFGIAAYEWRRQRNP